METDVIYNEDCVLGMNRIPDKSIDCIICDLPYGTTECKWDIIIPFDKLWKQYERIIKDKLDDDEKGLRSIHTHSVDYIRKLLSERGNEQCKE